MKVRGPERMLGYLDSEDNRAALDEEGWFRTGDVGVLDDAGFVTITGRLKDVINRGGEKFSAREIEDLLVAHPAVRQAAMVGGPDARFGEVPVAFVVRDGHAPALHRRTGRTPPRQRAGPPKDADRMAFHGCVANDPVRKS